MRETPGYEHLEYWCFEMTLGGVLTEADPDELAARAKIEDRDANRLLRVARKTPATRASKRRGRFEKAARAKARQVYCQQLAAALGSTGKDVVGELSYAAAHMVLATANAFGEAWYKRQVAW